MSEQVYEINPKGKYVIQFDHPISDAEWERFKLEWKRFIEAPNEHVCRLRKGIKLMKVEYPEIKESA
jgi:hypothetical protein